MNLLLISYPVLIILAIVCSSTNVTSQNPYLFDETPQALSFSTSFQNPLLFLPIAKCAI